MQKLGRDFTPEALQTLLTEARYHLGIVLYEADLDLDRAVSLLTLVTRDDPGNIPAYYHLGQAIRAQVERDMLERARTALETYLQHGAPLGYEAEVRQFLGVRRKAQI